MSYQQHTDSAGTSKIRIKAAGLIWICAVQFFVAQAVVQAAWTTPFSLATNYISDLGNTACADYPTAGEVAYVCSPLYALMNLSFFLQGVIIIAGTLLIGPLQRRGRAKSFVLILLVLTGIGMLGVGNFPENVNNDGHVYSAALQFITGNLALVVIGLTRIVPRAGKVYLAGSVMLGLTGLAATGLFPTGNDLGLGVGGMERVAAYTFPVWLIWTGLLLVTKTGKEVTE
ncbi:MAG: DUF998 domain-containing protein [Pyrinomonadaceae bacterium]